MKTPQQIQQQIDDIIMDVQSMKQNQFKSQKGFERAKNKARKQITHLKQLKFYLDCHPTRESIQNKITTLENRIVSLTEGQQRAIDREKQKRSNVDEKKLMKDFQKLMGIPQMKIQVQTLKSLLS